MYFRNRRSVRRSAQDRLKTEERMLVTRSADRGILPDSTPRLPPPTPTTTTNATTTSSIYPTIDPDPASTSTTTTSITVAATTTTNVSKKRSARSRAGTSKPYRDGEKTVCGADNMTHNPLEETGVYEGVAEECHGVARSSPYLPEFEASSHSNKGSQCLPAASSSPSPSVTVRLENSPEQLHQTSPCWPLPGFQHLHHQRQHQGRQSRTSPADASHTPSARRKKTSESFCDSRDHRHNQHHHHHHNQQQQQQHRTLRAAEKQQHHHQHQQQQVKTLKPSKHGFHLRSKSPTFKRLVEAAERLQRVMVEVVVEGRMYRGQPRSDRTVPRLAAGRASPATEGVVLPAVAGVWDGATAASARGGQGGEAGGGGGGDGARDYYNNDNDEEDEGEGAYLYPHPFLSSLPHSTFRAKQNTISAVIFDKHRQKRSVSTTMHTNPKHLEWRDNKTPDIFHHSGGVANTADYHLHRLSGWEVDSLNTAESSGGGAGVHARMTVPLNGTSFTGENHHTELHLFLPRLGDTVSEDGSVKTPGADQCHGHSYSYSRVAVAAETGSESPKRLRSQRSMPHLLPSHRGPQRSNSFHNHHHHHHQQHHQHQQQYQNQQQNQQKQQQHQHSAGTASAGEERGGRRSFVSPNARVGKGERISSNRKRVTAASPSPPLECYESYVYEPYLRGEHLKEKLEDLPTLISLDQD